ncbi:hypothetical protein [Paraburkholderia sp. BCC1886]|uniref:hypothetical protein n=1 Tax=Paraburkholderia sp. BCC1886 TaxID=2562670 RepID=UPI00118410EE|nr:hypothetical protein [Paraburkholderia sp. BCC1886]
MQRAGDATQLNVLDRPMRTSKVHKNTLSAYALRCRERIVEKEIGAKEPELLKEKPLSPGTLATQRNPAATMSHQPQKDLRYNSRD